MVYFPSFLGWHHLNITIQVDRCPTKPGDIKAFSKYKSLVVKIFATGVHDGWLQLKQRFSRGLALHSWMIDDRRAIAPSPFSSRIYDQCKVF